MNKLVNELIQVLNLKQESKNFFKGFSLNDKYHVFLQYGKLLHSENPSCYVFHNDAKMVIFSYCEGDLFLKCFDSKNEYFGELQKELKFYNPLEILFNNKTSYGLDKKEEYLITKDNILFSEELINEYRAAADLFAYDSNKKQVIITFTAGKTEIKKVRQYFSAGNTREFTVYYETLDKFNTSDSAITDYCKNKNIEFKYTNEKIQFLINNEWKYMETACFDGMVLIGY